MTRALRRSCASTFRTPESTRGALILLALLAAACGDEPIAPAEEAAGLGIYSESGQRLQPDVDVFIGTFSGGGAALSAFQADRSVHDEGSESLRATVSVPAAGFAGWFVAWGTASRVADDGYFRDMAAYTGGALRLSVRSPVDLEVGIRSGNVPAGTETSRTLLSAVAGFTPGPAWQRLCIPLAPLSGPAPAADLSRVKVLFVVASTPTSGGTGGAPATFWIDDVRWDPEPC
jgi:hypothetical protein